MFRPFLTKPGTPRAAISYKVAEGYPDHSSVSRIVLINEPRADIRSTVTIGFRLLLLLAARAALR